MAKKMTDDEIMDFTYNKLFGDLDNIESGAMFDEDGVGKSTQKDVADRAGNPGSPGIELTIKPLMAGSAEGARPPKTGFPEGENEEDEDKYKGISKMSPLMAQMHKDR